MNRITQNGTRAQFDDITKVFYDGYWIKCYEPPRDTLAAKKSLIHSLTRRLFNHMEHGINIPGRMLNEIRSAYEAEENPKKKRVKGAMLAGALFNRAADIFNHLVELEGCGIDILPGNDLMHECGQCLQEALQYGKLVKHRNGDEGIDELWGEPFKAFTMSMEDFYESRYVKISMTMKNIDKVAGEMAACFTEDPRFNGIRELIFRYAQTAQRKCETLRTDDEIFDVWSNFVVAGEDIVAFPPKTIITDAQQLNDVIDGKHLLKWGVRLIAFVTRARTPMPQSTQLFLAECKRYRNRPDSWTSQKVERN